MHTCRHQPGDVGHIHHQVSSHLVGHFSEPLKINGPAVGAGPCDDKFRLGGNCCFLQFVIINVPILIDAVGHNVEVQS